MRTILLFFWGRRFRGSTTTVIIAAPALGSAAWVSRCHILLPPPLRRCIRNNSIRFFMTTTESTPSNEDTANAIAIVSAEKDAGGVPFGPRFWIPASCIFLETPHSVALVNLRPIVPGHVLVISRRVVPYLRDLPINEYDDLWRTVRRVQAMLRRHFQNAADDANVAVQDGPGAGQSVPHVHVHILPRHASDTYAGNNNDAIYEALERWAPRESSDHHNDDDESPARLHVPPDAERRDRTVAEMAAEAKEYRQIVRTMADEE